MIQRDSFLVVRIEEVLTEENAWSRAFALNTKYFQRCTSYKMYKRSFILIWMFTWNCILEIFAYNSLHSVIESLLTTRLFQTLTQPCPSPHIGNLNLKKWGKHMYYWVFSYSELTQEVKESAIFIWGFCD